MSPASDLPLTILEKIGTPLVQAALATPALSVDEQTRLLIDLLEKSALAGMTLASKMTLPASGHRADSIRLSLTALCAALVAGHYRQTGRAPTERDEDRLLAALQGLLSFADGFSGAADADDRLRALTPDHAFALDETQIDLMFLKAFVPVIDAVAAFGFGYPDRRLLPEICEKLTAETRRIAGLRSAPSPQADRRAELLILSALASLYASCHRAETDRLMSMDEPSRSALATTDGLLPMTPVWMAFSLRVQMLEALSGFLPKNTGEDSARSGEREPAPARPLSSSEQTQPVTPASAPAVFSIPKQPSTHQPSTADATLRPQTLHPEEDSGISEQSGVSATNPMRFFKPGGASS